MRVGIDFDTNAIYLCALAPSFDTPCLSVAKLRTGGSLIEAIAAVPSALTMAVGHMHLDRGTEAWVERGTGFARTGDWPLGAIAGAIIATWSRLPNLGACRLVTTSDWKKNLGAPGNCNKQTANTYATLHWRAHYDTQPPTDHNQLDAYGIAVYAQAA